jgi:hypothetical protein
VGNQGSLREDVELFATEQKARDLADTKVTRDTTVNGDHGRIETRTTTVNPPLRGSCRRSDGYLMFPIRLRGDGNDEKGAGSEYQWQRDQGSGFIAGLFQVAA